MYPDVQPVVFPTAEPKKKFFAAFLYVLVLGYGVLFLMMVIKDPYLMYGSIGDLFLTGGLYYLLAPAIFFSLIFNSVKKKLLVLLVYIAVMVALGFTVFAGEALLGLYYLVIYSGIAIVASMAFAYVAKSFLVTYRKLTITLAIILPLLAWGAAMGLLVTVENIQSLDACTYMVEGEEDCYWNIINKKLSDNKGNQVQVCSDINIEGRAAKANELKTVCYVHVARTSGNIDACYLINEGIDRVACISETAAAKKDISLCNEIEEYQRYLCHNYFR